MNYGQNPHRDGFNGRNPVGRPIPFEGQNSNAVDDSDIKRGQPDFADPMRKGDDRPVLVEEEVLEGHVPKAILKKQAAVRDPVLAIRPDVRPFKVGDADAAYEPVQAADRKF